MHTAHGLGWWWQAFLFMTNATATITITETDDQLRVEIEYDPMPVKGQPPSHAAKMAHSMVNLFSQHQPADALISNTVYHADTGETFRKDYGNKT